MTEPDPNATPSAGESNQDEQALFPIAAPEESASVPDAAPAAPVAKKASPETAAA